MEELLKNEIQIPALIADYACETGENPLWHPVERRLYWIDIPTGRLFRYDPATGHHEQCYQGRIVGGFTIQADGSLLLFMDRGTIALWRDGGVGAPVWLVYLIGAITYVEGHGVHLSANSISNATPTTAAHL